MSIYDGEEQYQRDLEGFTAPQRYLFALQWYLAEVNNGGHDQFYSNSTGIVWEDAMNGAREMGMEELYGIIRESADRMGGKPAKEREDRWDRSALHTPALSPLRPAARPRSVHGPPERRPGPARMYPKADTWRPARRPAHRRF